MNQISLPAPACQSPTRRSEVCEKPRQRRIFPAFLTGLWLLAILLSAAPFAAAAAPQSQPAATNAAPSAATNAAPRASTNAAPRTARTTAPATHFNVRAYEITGNTLLSDSNLDYIASQHIGTNLTATNILEMRRDLQGEYAARGYATVEVVVPQQTIDTNVSIVKIQIVEGKLADILVAGNKHFSSNNVMRALPSLHTNIFLNSFVFQAELDRANRNQDRQIYPKILPGAEPGTSSLLLTVKDRLPLHGKFELNDLSSPGTPDMRMSGSIAYNNLWQMEHSLGVQYSFSPQALKAADQWAFFDRPLVANYSGFYRFPLRDPDSIGESVATVPGTFGYSEATRKFSLPPASGVPELNIYASRSTVDTGVSYGSFQNIVNTTFLGVDQQNSQEDWTVNEDLGFRFTDPLPEVDSIISTFSAGLDFKTYHTVAFATNTFTFIEHLQDPITGLPFDRTTVDPAAVPVTRTGVQYIPLSFRWDGTRADKRGNWSFGFGYSPNFTAGLLNNRSDFRAVTGSSRPNGNYQILTASLGREIIFNQNTNNPNGDWRLALRADGQWADQPLIPTEQFGDGGINGVRGYHEGEVFGDTGWRITSELKTQLYRTYIDGTTPTPVQVRGSVFMDYGQSFHIDPNGGGSAALWGTGFGFSGTIGSAIEARMLFGFPLLSPVPTDSRKFLFNFVVSAQF